MTKGITEEKNSSKIATRKIAQYKITRTKSRPFWRANYYSWFSVLIGFWWHLRGRKMQCMSEIPARGAAAVFHQVSQVGCMWFSRMCALDSYAVLLRCECAQIQLWDVIGFRSGFSRREITSVYLWCWWQRTKIERRNNMRKIWLKA